MVFWGGLSFLTLLVVFSAYYVFNESSFDDRGEASAPASLFNPVNWRVSIKDDYTDVQFTHPRPGHIEPTVYPVIMGTEIVVSLFINTQGADIYGLDMMIDKGHSWLNYSNIDFFPSSSGVWEADLCSLVILPESDKINRELSLHCFSLEESINGQFHLADLTFSSHMAEPSATPFHPAVDPSADLGNDPSYFFSISDVEFAYADGSEKPPPPNHFNSLYFLYSIYATPRPPRTPECQAASDCSRNAPFEACWVLSTKTGHCLKGDVNNDGNISMKDFQEFRKDFLAYKKGGWLESLRRSDFNEDERISMADYSVFVLSYRKINGLIDPMDNFIKEDAWVTR